MDGINLLPWRKDRRRRQSRNFWGLMLACVVMTALLMFLVHIQIARRTDDQRQRIQYLNGELALLDQEFSRIKELEKKKKNLIARMDVILKLQVSRPEVVHLFDEIVKTVPPGVQVIDLVQSDRLISINGIADSNTRVSNYLRNLDESRWFQHPSLRVIESGPIATDKTARRLSKFSVQVKQTEEALLELSKSPGESGVHP